LGITETFGVDQLVEEQIKSSQYLYIEGYLVTSKSATAAVFKAKEIAEKNNVKTALTFSDPSMVSYFKEGLVDMIGTGVDLLFCNETEALTFTGEKTFEEAVKKIKHVAKTFAITRGPKGAYLYDGAVGIEVVSQQVEALDTNGAGDVFAGTFLYGITHGMDFLAAGTIACSAASKLVTQFGARLTGEQMAIIKKGQL